MRLDNGARLQTANCFKKRGERAGDSRTLLSTYLTQRSPRMRRALDLMAGELLRDSSRTKRFTFSLARALSRRHTLPSARKAWART